MGPAVELGGAALQLVVQAGVLDGDGGVGGEAEEEVEIVGIERADGGALGVEDADDGPVEAEGRGHLGAPAFEARHVAGVLRDVGDGLGRAVRGGLTHAGKTKTRRKLVVRNGARRSSRRR